jgi:hypothetical protein
VQIRTLGDENPNFYQDACRALELSDRLFPLFLESSYDEKASILKLLASNYSPVNSSDVSIIPTHRKPFDKSAEGLSRLNWEFLLRAAPRTTVTAAIATGKPRSSRVAILTIADAGDPFRAPARPIQNAIKTSTPQ